MKNVGYFFWGHLSDKVSNRTKDTPDGNAWYSSSIITEFLDRGFNVHHLGKNRDLEDFNEFGTAIFKGFEQPLRVKAYSNIVNSDWIKTEDDVILNNYPKLDILLLEWRFPIPTKNTKECFNLPIFQPDLYMQNSLLKHYVKEGIPIFIFDLDYKLGYEDEKNLQDFYSPMAGQITILETSKEIKQYVFPRISVEIPFWMKYNSSLRTMPISPYKKLAYIGSRYDRDTIIEHKIVPFSRENPFTVWFYGNWRTYPDKYRQLYDELKWWDIQFHSRVGHSDFRKIYQDAVACPLLAKPEYFERGFMTARIQECLYFGSVPIGFEEHLSIEKYLPTKLIVTSKNTINKIVDNLMNMSLIDRHILRMSIWKNLSFMDCSNFVDKILGAM